MCGMIVSGIMVLFVEMLMLIFLGVVVIFGDFINLMLFKFDIGLFVFILMV